MINNGIIMEIKERITKKYQHFLTLQNMSFKVQINKTIYMKFYTKYNVPNSEINH